MFADKSEKEGAVLPTELAVAEDNATYLTKFHRQVVETVAIVQPDELENSSAANGFPDISSMTREEILEYIKTHPAVVAIGTGSESDDLEEDIHFDVVLVDIGNQKLHFVKFVRELTGLSLRSWKARIWWTAVPVS